MKKWHYFCCGERISSVTRTRDDVPKIGDPVTIVGRAAIPAPAEHFVFVSIDEAARTAELERR